MYSHKEKYRDGLVVNKFKKERERQRGDYQVLEGRKALEAAVGHSF